MSSTRIDVFVHFTWQTKYRRRILEDDLEEFVHEQIRETARELDLQTIALESAWDHTHALFRWNATTTFADAAQLFKGRTAYRWNNEVRDPSSDPELEWQAGFGAFSIRKDQVETVARYVRLQKQRHHDEELWWRFERHLWRPGEDAV